MGRIAMRKFHLWIPDSTKKHTFQAGQEVPDDLVQYVTNKAVWIGEGDFNNTPDLEEPDDIQDELSKLTVRQLAKLCIDKHITPPNNARKADLLEVLRAAGVTSVV